MQHDRLSRDFGVRASRCDDCCFSHPQLSHSLSFLFFCFPFSSSPSIFPSFHLLARSFGSLRIGAPNVCRYWWKEQPAEARGRRPPQRGTSISHPNPPAVSGPISLTRTPPCPRHQTKQSNTAFSVSARDPPSHPARRLPCPSFSGTSHKAKRDRCVDQIFAEPHRSTAPCRAWRPLSSPQVTIAFEPSSVVTVVDFTRSHSDGLALPGAVQAVVDHPRHGPDALAKLDISFRNRPSLTPESATKISTASVDLTLIWKDSFFNRVLDLG